ncbi:peptidoglycan DD-metalloendopeptidase family protein [Sphingomonas sp. BN140010]|uniref:Peptidoglycan DD-metalloendopeptidase family protein n=1 Tax=Sphingomonas arvum TaxID=2992113 RepID=A0ABT3JBF2_9SPHN|nr:peptidoglycan DD-metalloendopeptidase family protein [Sphingomonas sp. BN140010]MCW3796387.1 peptidoglycan DD-metalloendopeptidase family protein [Sphingomonas sp. BN140010]
MRALAPLALMLLAPALLSAADPLTAARAEAAAAAREQARLEALVRRAEDAAGKLRAEQAAAAQAIIAAEAAVAEADVRAAELQRQLDGQRERLTREQRPAALLLAGLAQIGRRPPLLQLADARSVEDLVHLRAVLDATLPAVTARTAALRTELRRGEALASAAAEARSAKVAARTQLAERQRRFAAVEAQSNRRLVELGSAALGAGDVVLARQSEAERAESLAAERRTAARTAAQLARLEPAPPRPAAPAGAAAPPPLAWQVPLRGPVLTGLAEISASGVRSRGLTIGSRYGAPVTVPAAGRIAFAGPFRSHASVIILDHGHGWMTLLTGVRTDLAVGSELGRGEALGQATGTAVAVELSRDGRPQPAALIAGSSALLSNDRQPS